MTDNHPNANLAAARPITCLDPAALQGWLQHADPAARRWAETSGFSGQPGSTLLLSDADGRIRAALAGIGQVGDPMAYAFLPLTLPAGDYRIDDSGLAPDPAIVRLGWTLGSYRFLRYRRAERVPARLLDTAEVLSACLPLIDAATLVIAVSQSGRSAELVRLAGEIEQHGFNTELNSYTQTYDNEEVDASLLQLPHIGYLSFDDPRMLGTVEKIDIWGRRRIRNALWTT